MKKFILILSFFCILLPFKSQTSMSICAGSSTVITATNPLNLSSPQYTVNPGNVATSLPSFTVSPSSTTTYTLLTGGVNSSSTYTVSAITVTVFVNPLPAGVVSPSSQTISCPASGSVTVNVVTPGVNGEIKVISPFGGFMVAPSNTLNYTCGPSANPYSVTVKNMVTGCASDYTFSVISTGTGYPTYNLTSVPNGFTLGCSTKSVTTVYIINPLTSPPGGNYSVGLMSPGTSSLTLGAGVVYSATVPGTYTVAVKSAINQCITWQLFSIIQNTTAPVIDTLINPFPVLDCYTPAKFVQTVWHSTAGTFTNTISVSINTATPSSSIISNYSLNLIDTDNFCVTSSVISMYQNIYPPKPLITGSGTLTCSSPSLVLSHNSTTGIPPNAFPSPNLVVAQNWFGPVPQSPLNLSTTYTAVTPGVYTLVAKDLNNGCTSQTTAVVFDARQVPGVTAAGPFVLCDNVLLAPVITGSSNLTYTWYAPPSGSLVGNSATINAYSVGEYTLDVADASGCSKRLYFVVNPCITGIGGAFVPASVNITPNPSAGVYRIECAGYSAAATIQVITVTGELVKSVTSVSNNILLDLLELPDGLYFIRMSDEQNAIVKMVIKWD
jgi:hypothetical protein